MPRRANSIAERKDRDLLIKHLRNGDRYAEHVLRADWLYRDADIEKLLRPAQKKPVPRCLDCGAPGECVGHQTCQYPQNHP